MNTSNHKKVLISGASFAGLSTAYWMNSFGYQVTIVEIAPALKKGGTPVNILGDTIGIVKRMGLFDQILANRLTMEIMEFKNADNTTERRDLVQKHHADRGEVEYEIERDLLLSFLYEAVQDDVTFIFGDSITGLEETNNHMEVSFKNAPNKAYDLVFGCDGIHSTVRKLWFGHEVEYSIFLQTYFSIAIVDKLLVPEFTTQMYSEPGKTVMLNAYNGKTDICLAYFSEKEVTYDYRNEQQQRNRVYDQFVGSAWRIPELLEEVKNSKSFYFDKLCQMRMPSWTKGRVALVGDAGYCPSPAAGRGGSIAIDGAGALADAFEKHKGNYEMAFQEYNACFRPFIEELQADVVKFNLNTLIPKTAEAIRKRNKDGFV